MDPNKALADLRQAYSDVEDTIGRQDHPLAEAAAALRDAAVALDEWLSGGGFLPADWQRK